MKYLLLLPIAFFFNCNKIQDCRSNNSCPIFYPKNSEFKYDLNGNQINDYGIDRNQKITILTSKDGIQEKIIKNELELVKILFEEKEFLYPSKKITIGKLVRIANLKGVQIKENPDLKSKTIGELSYNSTVEIFSEQERKNNILGEFYKIKSPKSYTNIGWVLISDLTDGDYEASLYKKTISEILSNLTVNLTDSSDSNSFIITSNPNELEKPNCLIKGKECYAKYTSREEESYDHQPAELSYWIDLTPDKGFDSPPDYICRMEHSLLVGYFPLPKKDIFKEEISCDKYNY
ncbi:SH3 domain-containing protein [Leptospira kanakyensis]|uniref:SH3 domain-containing protein n=1 Tax=Leptospira kanakyensis TaxID=2484968 RepID=A0A6N4Q2M5_9LEPT|nr:SH3 domain-containing protein [Leptospira kanakyensis]TGK55730.1 SH3 domain-containing protein [Leptospira kanakyensis]TGK59802.1 SH3 domain-containing protein [Leptospira kanakyensis]TGK71956.1 SH3 domain-containing protein [Leptospira kanakyensis]